MTKKKVDVIKNILDAMAMLTVNSSLKGGSMGMVCKLLVEAKDAHEASEGGRSAPLSKKSPRRRS